MPIFLKVNHQLESRMPEIGPSGSEGGAKISFAPTPIVRKRSPSRRDDVIMYSRVGLQRSCWHVLSSVTESTAAPTQSSCPPGTDRFFLRHSRHFVPGYRAVEALITAGESPALLNHERTKSTK